MIIKQIVLFGDTAPFNQELLTGFRATRIGICAPAGTLFWLNHGQAIEINEYKIYELDVSNYGYLTSLIVQKPLDEAKVIIDLIGEEIEVI